MTEATSSATYPPRTSASLKDNAATSTGGVSPCSASESNASRRAVGNFSAMVASAGCDPGAKLISNEQSRRDATTWEDAQRAQIDLDVAAIIVGMISVHRPRGASLQSER